MAVSETVPIYFNHNHNVDKSACMHVMFYTIIIIISYDNSQCEITHRSKYNHVQQL